MEIQSLGEVEEVPRSREEGAEEPHFPTSVAAVAGQQRLAGSTGSRRHSSGTHRRRRRDQMIHSTGRTARCNLQRWRRWMIQERLGRRGWQMRREIAGDGCYNRHIHHHLHHPRHDTGRRAGHSHRSCAAEGCP